MGKKSKNPSKKSNNKDNANIAHTSIQELQSGINSMSINDAFAAVKMATNSINQMKAEQQRAAERLKAARAEVERAKLDKSNNDLYADVNFWEKRYKDEASNISNTPEIYEWYLDSAELMPLLLPDIAAARQRQCYSSSGVGDVLVSGCGNSSLCEDLHNAGVADICGMDYSPSVVAAMTQRLAAPSRAAMQTRGGVRYICADGTAMPAHMTASCSVVVDKGTLDAITSGGVEAAGDSKGTSDALAYMREMWRVLRPEGVFVVVSTMPPALFHLVGACVVPALANEADTEQQHPHQHQHQRAVCSGPGYRINAFCTKEGGSVFYYALLKPAAEAPASQYHPLVSASSNTNSNTNSSCNTTSSASQYDQVMAETQAALLELRQAQAEVQRRAQAASALSQDLHATEGRASRLSQQLDGDLSARVVSDIVQEARSSSSSSGNSSGSAEVASPLQAVAGMAGLRDDVSRLEHVFVDSQKQLASAAAAAAAAAIAVNPDTGGGGSSFRSSVPAGLALGLPSFPSAMEAGPAVSLALLLPSPGLLQAGGGLEVQFTITEGKWDEDDFISIHPCRGGRRDNSSEFDYFEYTEQPVGEFSSSLGTVVQVGVCRLTLPPVGGPCYVTYRRTFTSIASKTRADVEPGEDLVEGDAVVTRQNREVTRSEEFQVTFRVQPLWTATSAGAQCRSLQLSRLFMQLLSAPSLLLSPELDSLCSAVEDLQSIRIIVVTIKTNPESEMFANCGRDSCSFSRVSAWLSREGGSGGHSGGAVVSVEADCNDQLSYLHVVLPDYPSAYELLMAQSTGQVVPGENSVVIRIPYRMKAAAVTAACGQQQEQQKEQEQEEQQQEEQQQEGSGSGVQCALCGCALTAPAALCRAQLLPSGKFDHMMHEFLCSENPLTPLAMSDMETCSGSILVGNIFTSVSAEDIVGGRGQGGSVAVVLRCKTSPSLIDAVSSEVSASVGRAAGSAQQQVSVIDTSTCAVSCERCGAYLGDGQIVDREEEEEGVPNRGDFSLSDLSIIRFLRHRVQWRKEGKSTTTAATASATSTITAEGDREGDREGEAVAWSLLASSVGAEQVLAQVLVAASALFGTSSFELYVPDVPSMRLRVRLLSRPAADASAQSSASLSGYTVSVSPPSPRGRPIAVDFADFEEVCVRLRAREHWRAPSFRAGETIGYLLT